MNTPRQPRRFAVGVPVLAPIVLAVASTYLVACGTPTPRLSQGTESAAEQARYDAATPKVQTSAPAATVAAPVAKAPADDLKKQIADLGAQQSDRGLVVTLGSQMFASGQSDLQESSMSNLGKLATFLNHNPDRMAAIEGYTDNTGSDSGNRDLSLKRADAVKSFLVQKGVASTRLTTTGKGKDSPVASNDSATGRQQNRRVEVVIAQATTK